MWVWLTPVVLIGSVLVLFGIFIFLGAQGSIDTGDVMGIAQTAASRIDAAGLGS